MNKYNSEEDIRKKAILIKTMLLCWNRQKDECYTIDLGPNKWKLVIR